MIHYTLHLRPYLSFRVIDDEIEDPYAIPDDMAIIFDRMAVLATSICKPAARNWPKSMATWNQNTEEYPKKGMTLCVYVCMYV